MIRSKKAWVRSGRRFVARLRRSGMSVAKYQELYDEHVQAMLDNTAHHQIFWYAEGAKLWWRYGGQCKCRRCDQPIRSAFYKRPAWAGPSPYGDRPVSKEPPP